MKLVPGASPHMMSVILLESGGDSEPVVILDPNSLYKMLRLIFAYINTGWAPAVRKLQSLTLTLAGTT